MEKMNIYQKLIEVRKSVPYLKKAKEGYQYYYVTGADVLGALKTKMDEFGLLLVPKMVSKEVTTDIFDKVTEITKWSNGKKEKSLVYNPITKKEEIEVKIDRKKEITVNCEMIFVWIDSGTGENLEVPFFAFGTQDDVSKAYGSALTYSERYFLLKFFNIATDGDDPDAFQKKHQEESNQEGSKLDKQEKIIKIEPKENKENLAKSNNKDYDSYCKEIAKCTTVTQLNDLYKKIGLDFDVLNLKEPFAKQKAFILAVTKEEVGNETKKN